MFQFARARFRALGLNLLITARILFLQRDSNLRLWF